MNIPLFDAHCDTVMQMTARKYGLYSNPGHIDLKRSLEYMPYAQFFALFALDGSEMKKFTAIPPELDYKTALELIPIELEVLTEELKKNSDKIMLCTTSGEAAIARAEGKAAAFLAVEGAELIGCDEFKLREMHKRGLRLLTFIWNNPNALIGDNRLTEHGRRFVGLCNELGIIIDVSHMQETPFWDIIELTKDPIIASHSNSRAIWDHRRNLYDDQFCAIIKNGGVSGINLYADFLGEKPDIGTVIGHIEHFLSLGGEKNIAIGGDLDGCEKLPEGISGIEDLKKVYNELLRKNYPESLVRDIFYNNLMRVVEEVCDT